MVRKSRSDKKDTTCKRCGKVCVNPNKLREHLRRKNPCRPRTDNQEAIQEPIQVPIQMSIQVSIQTPVQASPIQVPIQASIQKIIRTPVQAPVQAPAKVPIKDTSFKDLKIEWEYQN